MTANYLIKAKLKARRTFDTLAGYRPRRPRRWTTRASASSLEAAKLIAAQAGHRSNSHLEAAVFHRGKIVARLAIAIAAVLLVGCAPHTGPRWTVRHDPNGLGYWAAPADETLRFYPSRYSNPVTPKGARPHE